MAFRRLADEHPSGRMARNLIGKIRAIQEGSTRQVLLAVAEGQTEEVVIGMYDPADRRVHLQQLAFWTVNHRLVRSDTVPKFTVEAGVIGANSWLKRQRVLLAIGIACSTRGKEPKPCTLRLFDTSKRKNSDLPAPVG